MTLINYWKKS